MTSGSKGISVDKTADLGVVITALEVIQPGFLVAYITVRFVQNKENVRQTG